MSESSTAAESPLLTALRRLPTGSLYTLGDKAQLLKSFELCRKDAVRPPHWDRGRSSLAVEVVGSRVREVTLELEKGRLSVCCECRGATSARFCRHVLAALFTLKKALAPATVAGWGGSEGLLKSIRTALIETAPIRRGTGKTPEKPAATPRPGEFAVVVEESCGIPFIEIVRNGLAAQPFAPDLPAPLHPLVKSPYGYGIRPAAVLTALLDKGDFPWPVLARAEERLTPLAVEPPSPRRGLLRLDARKEGVLASRILDDGTSLGNRLFHFGSWVADFDGGRMVRVAAPEIWALWEEIEAVAEPVKEGYRLDWKDFLGLELLAEPDLAKPPLEELRLVSLGEEQAAAAESLATYGLEVNADGETVFLSAGARVGERLLTLDRRALALFTESFVRRTSPALRAFKRRRVLYETFLAARAAVTKTERTRVVRATLRGPDFLRRAVTREAREILEEFFALDRKATWHLTFAEGRWQALRRDRDREAGLLEILYRHFGEPAFREALVPGELRVPREAFFARLPQLAAELGEAGADLRFSGRSLTSASLEISIDATRADIDWFELRPEIRCGGELLNETAWRQALAQGVFETGGMLRLLDEPGRAALSLLKEVTGPAVKNNREVVRIPRLHILDLLAFRRLGATLELSREDAEILDSLERFDSLPEVDNPRLGSSLRDYQHLGYRWLAFLYRNKFGACLADDMGLGKTIQAISLLAALQQGILPSRAATGTPHLVVVPPSLLFNWESELARFAPSLSTRIYRGQGRVVDFSGVDVVLTSYDLVRRDIAKLAALPFHVIVFDEAQAVKNVHAAVTGAVRRLQGAFKVALTGTPVENHLGEYWSIIDLVLPGLLGPYRHSGKGREEAGAQQVQRLIARSRPFVLRRTKEKIASELPDKVEIDQHLELTAQQRGFYQKTVEEVRNEVAAAWQTRTAAQARITALAALTRLRRLCLAPRLVEPEADAGHSPKIEALCEHLEELLEEGHSVLVFSQFTSFLDLVEPALTERQFPFLRLDGSTPVGARKRLVERFQGSAEPLVFLLSLKAGGRGLNLTRASYVVHLDPWWNPAVENQASDRAHRIGQTQKVTVLRLLMRHTVEEKMMLLKKRKERLYRALLEEGRDGGGVPLTREDFEFLVGGDEEG